MNAIVSTGFTSGIASHLLASSSGNIRETITQKEFSSAREIKDTAILSKMSQKLSTSEDSTPLPVPQELVKDNLAAVKNFIAGHNEEALEQQANQSPNSSIKLIEMGV